VGSPEPDRVLRADASAEDRRHPRRMIGAYWQMHDMGTGWWLLMSVAWIVL
jgi:hypothetical protein